MAEKTAAENSQLKKERFEFVLTINGFIVCQRYFHINRFKDASLGSNELRSTIYECVKLIKDDLKAKSNIYAWYTEPQHFNDEAQMRKWEARPTFRLEVPSFAVLDNTGETFVWNGSKMEPYGKPVTKSEDDAPCVLKFAFLDSGNEVSSYSWDGKVYPKFVRTNIDLSNSSNRYSGDNVYAPMEEFLIDRFIASQGNIIPQIIRKICNICSTMEPDEYTYNLVIENVAVVGGEYATVSADYGYPASSFGTYRDTVRRLEKKYRKKTEAYYKKA
jgi:hypothetical protein